MSKMKVIYSILHVAGKLLIVISLLLVTSFQFYVKLSYGNGEVDHITQLCLSQDKDRDGILDVLESTYPYSNWLDPNESDELLARVHQYLEKNGLNENEKILFSFLLNLTENIVPQEIKEAYFKAGRVVEYWYGGKHKEGYHYWTYITPDEIKWYQVLLLNSILNDHKVSEKEANALRFLYHYKRQGRWYLILDIIASNMINDKYLDKDFDLDGINNYEELERGTNPLNNLETNPDNLSERYAIITPPLMMGGSACGYNERASWCYHILRKHGYSDKNIFLFLLKNEIPPPNQFSPAKLLFLNCGEVKVDYYFSGISSQSLRNYLRDHKCWDSNDEILVFEMGHGLNCNRGSNRLVKLLAEWQPYGRIVWIRFTCYAGSFFRFFAMNKDLHNFVGVECMNFPACFIEGAYYDFYYIIPRAGINYPFGYYFSDLFFSLKEIANTSICWPDEEYLISARRELKEWTRIIVEELEILRFQAISVDKNAEGLIKLIEDLLESYVGKNMPIWVMRAAIKDAKAYIKVLSEVIQHAQASNELIKKMLNKLDKLKEELHKLEDKVDEMERRGVTRVPLMRFYFGKEREKWLNYWNPYHYIPSTPISFTLMIKTDPALVRDIYGGLVIGEGRYENGTVVEIIVSKVVYSDQNRTRFVLQKLLINGRNQSCSRLPIRIPVNIHTSVIAIYKLQYKLSVCSQYGNVSGEGWYDAFSIAKVSIKPTKIGFLVKRVFKGWVGDIDYWTDRSEPYRNSTIYILMNNPKSVTAIWETDLSQLYIVIAFTVIVSGIMVIIFIKRHFHKIVPQGLRNRAHKGGTERL